MSERKVLIIVSLCATMLFGLLALVVTYGYSASFDAATLLAIRDSQSAALDGFFVWVTQLGGVIVVTLATLLLCGLLAYQKKYGAFIFVAVSMGGMIILNLLLKALFDRSRPDLWEWIVTETGRSFPSGHATASMALALVLLFIFWKSRFRAWLATLAVAYVLLISVSRLYLGVHFPTDIVGGWLLAVVWVSIVAAITLRLRTAKTTKGSTAV